MASLTTVYMLSVLLSSAAGMGAAFVGNRIYPLTGGTAVPQIENIQEAPKDEIVDEPTPVLSSPSE